MYIVTWFFIRLYAVLVHLNYWKICYIPMFGWNFPLYIRFIQFICKHRQEIPNPTGQPERPLNLPHKMPLNLCPPLHRLFAVNIADLFVLKTYWSILNIDFRILMCIIWKHNFTAVDLSHGKYVSFQQWTWWIACNIIYRKIHYRNTIPPTVYRLYMTD